MASDVTCPPRWSLHRGGRVPTPRSTSSSTTWAHGASGPVPHRQPPSASSHLCCAPPLLSRTHGVPTTTGTCCPCQVLSMATANRLSPPRVPHPRRRGRHTPHIRPRTTTQPDHSQQAKAPRPTILRRRFLRPHRRAWRGGPGGTGICGQVQRGRGGRKSRCIKSCLKRIAPQAGESGCLFCVLCSYHAPLMSRPCLFKALLRNVTGAVLRSRFVVEHATVCST